MQFKFTPQIQLWGLLVGLFFWSGSIQAETTPNTMCNVNWITTSNSITVSGLDASHVIFKFFRPDWSTEFTCVDNCDNPITLTGLTAGATYHLSYNLYDVNW